MPARLRPRTDAPYQIAQNEAAKAAIRLAWTAARGRPADAAEALGISRTTLYREINRLGMAAELAGFRAASQKVS